MEFAFTSEAQRTLDDFVVAVEEHNLKAGIPVYTMPVMCINGNDIGFNARLRVEDDGRFEFKFYMESMRAFNNNDVYEQVTYDFGTDVKVEREDWQGECWTFSGARDPAKAAQLVAVAAHYMNATV